RGLPRLHHGTRRVDARVPPPFLRSLEEAELITPQGSAGAAATPAASCAGPPAPASSSTRAPPSPPRAASSPSKANSPHTPASQTPAVGRQNRYGTGNREVVQLGKGLRFYRPQRRRTRRVRALLGH